jgi:hypothetical protein
VHGTHWDDIVKDARFGFSAKRPRLIGTDLRNEWYELPRGTRIQCESIVYLAEYLVINFVLVYSQKIFFDFRRAATRSIEH